MKGEKVTVKEWKKLCGSDWTREKESEKERLSGRTTEKTRENGSTRKCRKRGGDDQRKEREREWETERMTVMKSER